MSKITTKELEALLDELEKLNSKISELLKTPLNNGRRTIKDGIVSFDQSERDNRLLILTEQKKTIEEIVNNSEIVELAVSPNTVSPGNIVKVQLTPQEGDSEIVLVTLSENNSFGGGGNGEIASFSIGSPLGQCILGKGVGFSGNYNVGNNVFLVEILKITEA